MKTEVKKIDQHKRELTVQVEGDIVKQKFDQVYKRINKEAKIPGFRPGNVPRDILEKHYSSLAQQEILKELLPEVYNQALTEVSLEPVSLPEISQVNLNQDSLSFKANLEVKPAIELKNYKGLKVEYKPIQVSEDEINQALDRLKQAHAPGNSVSGGADVQMSESDFAHSLVCPNLKVLKEAIERQIHLEKTRAQQVNLENGIIEQLLGQLNVQVPTSLINQQSDSLVRQAELDLTLRGMSKEDIEKQVPELRKNLEPQAKRQVLVFLVLEEVARRENIARDDKMSQRVLEFLLRQADWKWKEGKD
jgi:FKBP-type peptidyl-prolyl cis-trans isomerase (trigger factor)